MQVPLTQSQVGGRRRYDLAGVGSLSAEPQMTFDRIASTTDGRRYRLAYRVGARHELDPVALDGAGRIVGRMVESRWSYRKSVDWYGTQFRLQVRGKTDPTYQLETDDRQPMATFSPFSSVLDLAQPVDPGLLLLCIWSAMVDTRIREFQALEIPVIRLKGEYEFEVAGIGRVTRDGAGLEGNAVTVDGHGYYVPWDRHGLCAVDARRLTVGRFHDWGFFGRQDTVQWRGWRFLLSYRGNLLILHLPDGRPLTTIRPRDNWTGPEPGIVNCYESVDAGLVLFLARIALNRAYAPKSPE
ncbi:MAG: hypothetical protein QM650_17110 [Microlunatus sp.]